MKKKNTLQIAVAAQREKEQQRINHRMAISDREMPYPETLFIKKDYLQSDIICLRTYGEAYIEVVKKEDDDTLTYIRKDMVPKEHPSTIEQKKYDLLHKHLADAENKCFSRFLKIDHIISRLPVYTSKLSAVSIFGMILCFVAGTFSAASSVWYYIGFAILLLVFSAMIFYFVREIKWIKVELDDEKDLYFK